MNGTFSHVHCARTRSKACTHFPTYTHQSGYEGTLNDTCPICLDQIAPEASTLVHTACNRAFCEDCITHWLGRDLAPRDWDGEDRRSCPNCVREVRVPENVVRLRRAEREAERREAEMLQGHWERGVARQGGPIVWHPMAGQAQARRNPVHRAYARPRTRLESIIYHTESAIAVLTAVLWWIWGPQPSWSFWNPLSWIREAESAGFWADHGLIMLLGAEMYLLWFIRYCLGIPQPVVDT